MLPLDYLGNFDVSVVRIGGGFDHGLMRQTGAFGVFAQGGDACDAIARLPSPQVEVSQNSSESMRWRELCALEAADRTIERHFSCRIVDLFACYRQATPNLTCDTELTDSFLCAGGFPKVGNGGRAEIRRPNWPESGSETRSGDWRS